MVTKPSPLKPILSAPPRRARTVKAPKASARFEVDLEAGTVSRITTAGDLENTEVRSLAEFLANLSGISDTGLLPPGVIRHRQAGTEEQVVVVVPSGINRLGYSEEEGSSEYQTYLVAQPYRIVIGDFKEDNLVGVRMFYSPTYPATPDAALYMPNLNNVNAMGYSQTSVGWLCLYPEGRSHPSLADKAAALNEVASGEYTYNHNMDDIDGPAFYQSMNKPSYLYSLEEWEAKTEAEGLDWVTEEGVWIPIKVADPGSDNDCYDPEGVDYLLSHAMDLGYRSAYEQDLAKAVQNTKTLNPPLAREILTRAFTQAGAAKAQPKVATKAKATFSETIKIMEMPAEPISITVTTTPPADAPAITDNVECLSCNGSFPATFTPAGPVSAECPGCGFIHAYCVHCGRWFDIDDRAIGERGFACPDCV